MGQVPGSSSRPQIQKPCKDRNECEEVTVEDRKLRIAAVGDELLAGLGDPRALGWLGRVLARTPQDTVVVESFSLPCPMEGTEGLASRWQDEAGRRFSDAHENRLVIGLSGRDLEFGLSTAIRIALGAQRSAVLRLSCPTGQEWPRSAWPWASRRRSCCRDLSRASFLA